MKDVELRLISYIELLLSSAPQLPPVPDEAATDYPKGSNDNDLILVNVTKEMVAVTKKPVRIMSKQDNDSEEIDDLDLLTSLLSKKYLIGPNTKQLESPEKNDDRICGRTCLQFNKRRSTDF